MPCSACARRRIVVVVVPGDRRRRRRARRSSRVAAAASAALDVVAGGETRQDSVARGLAVLPHGVDTVLVHDAARALTPSTRLRRGRSRAVRARGRGIIPALDVVDTDQARRRATAACSRRSTGRSSRARADAAGLPARRARSGAYATPRRSSTRMMRRCRRPRVSRSTWCPATRVVQDHAAGRPAPGRALVAERTGDDAHGARASGRDRRDRAIGTGIDVHAFADDAEHPALARPACTGPTSAGSRATATATPRATRSATRCSRPRGSATSAACFGTADPRFDGRARRGLPAPRRSRLVGGAGFVGRQRHACRSIGNRPKLAPRRAEAEALLSGILGAPVSVARHDDRRARLHRPGRGRRGDRDGARRARLSVPPRLRAPRHR